VTLGRRCPLIIQSEESSAGKKNFWNIRKQPALSLINYNPGDKKKTDGN
jgi:hypothetical protein